MDRANKETKQESAETELLDMSDAEHSHITASLRDDGHVVIRQLHDGKKRKGVDEIHLDRQEWDKLCALDVDKAEDSETESGSSDVTNE